MIMQGAHCDQLSCCHFIAQCCVLSSISKRFAFASVQCSRSILQGPPIYPTMKSFILEVDGKSFALPEEALRQHEGSMLAAWKDWPTTTSDEQPHHASGSWSADVFRLIVRCLHGDDPLQVKLDGNTL